MRMYPVALVAGGLATRLRPLTEKIPKALVEVNGQPFIAHQLRLLRSQGIDRVVVCTGYLGEMIEAFAGDGRAFGLRVEYSPDGPGLRGTAGAVRNALDRLGDRFFVVYGDSYLECDYADVARRFDDSGKLGLMTVFRNEGQWDASNVEYAGGRILAYDKQQRTGRMQYIDWGLERSGARPSTPRKMRLPRTWPPFIKTCFAAASWRHTKPATGSTKLALSKESKSFPGI